MNIKHTYITKTESERYERQLAAYRRCVLLLKAGK